MSDNKPPDSANLRPPASQPGTDEKSHPAIRELLRATSEHDDQSELQVLSGFQKKLRQRSAGKFYADGWSTSKEPPIMTYLITSLIMLAIVGTAYLVLYPLSGAADAVDMTPAPVQIVAPR
jgi:hypothetical protein